MSTIIRGSGDTTFGGTIQSTGIDDNATSTKLTVADTGIDVTGTEISLQYGAGNNVADSRSIVIGTNGQYGNSSNLKKCNINFEGHNNNIKGQIQVQERTNTGNESPMLFSTTNGSNNLTERMRIDSSGNVLVGTTSTDVVAANTVGINLKSDGKIAATRDSSFALHLNRKTTDGDIVQFRKDGSTVGSIGNRDSDDLYLNTAGGTGSLSVQGTEYYSWAAAYFYPRTDNARDLGTSSSRWDDVYATNGTIQTSDRNEKQDIEELSEAEQRVAIACKGLLRKFRWQDSVAEKGDDARIHFGIIAQDLQDAFAAEGLDAGDYAMFISTTWYEKLVPVDAVIGVEAVEAVEAKDAYTRTDTKDEPTEGYTERTRLGVRYPELLAFIISAI